MESLIVIVLFIGLIALYNLVPKSTKKPKEFGKGMLINSNDSDFRKG